MTSPELMVERLVQAGMKRGRRELANLAYGMARTCVYVAEGGNADHFRTYTEVRSITDQRSDLSRMSKRVDDEVDMSALPLAAPLPDHAALAGSACLELAESIEGCTARTQYLQAMLVRATGDHSGAADRIRHMLKTPLTRRWWLLANEGLQLTLFGAEDYAEIVLLGQRLLQEDPGRTTAVYNVLASYACMGMREEYLKEAPRFTQSLIGAEDSTFWEHILRREAAAFAEVVDLDPADVLGLIPKPRSSRDS